MKKRRVHSPMRMNLSDAEYQMIDRLAKNMIVLMPNLFAASSFRDWKMNSA